MLLAQAGVALVTAHFLPGLLVVEGLRLGRSPIERAVLAAVLGGPVAALIYWTALVSEWDPVYWVLIVGLDVAAIFVLYKSRAVASIHTEASPSWKVLLGLLCLLAAIEAAYFATTGRLFRLDSEGNLLMDRALQRDTLFHVGMVRSLLASYPPELLSCAGVDAAYHVVYHLQIAAWSRFFDIDALDGVYRVGMGWSLALLILSAFLLGRRFARSDRVGLIATVLIFGSGLGFVFLRAPRVDWWSLAFMDVTLISVFLINPLLTALPLVLMGFLCLEDFLENGRKVTLAGCGLCLISLLRVKVFLGVQAIGGIIVSSLLVSGEGSRRARQAALVLSLCALPWLVPLFVGEGGGNTAIGVRPLEIVRYSMEKLGWTEAVRALAEIGRGNWGTSRWAVAAAATLLWGVGFLGLRLVALPGLMRDASRVAGTIRTPMAFAVWMGFPVALVFRIAPAEATGLSRLEAINDVIWFAAQSGFLMWFWTAEVVSSLTRRSWTGPIRVAVVVALALPATLQHFVYKASLDVDVVPAALVEAAEKAGELSNPGDVWVEPLNRVRPSWVAYLAGRPVVYDSYVGYDYMFVARDELDYRRHALAQFWKSTDSAYASWFLRCYGVRAVLAPVNSSLPRGSQDKLHLVFSNSAARIYRVSQDMGDVTPMRTPKRLPMGLAGAHYFGRGWDRPSRSRTRRLGPGNATLYLPIQAGTQVTLHLELVTPHPAGRMRLGAKPIELEAGRERIRLVFPRVDATRLHRLGLDWEGAQPLVVKHIDVSTDE